MTAYLQFLNGIPDSSLLYIGVYNPRLVVLSILIAVFASYAALDVAAQVGEADNRRAKSLWLAIGSLAMGGGIWAMHFIGMLAFNLPCGVQYDPAVTIASMVPGILASGVALHLISHATIRPRQLVAGGVLLGAGIGTMHYSGMAALRMDALLRFDPALFALSIAVAVVLAILALWVKFRLTDWGGAYRRWAHAGSAVVMGGAISGMHYTAMGAAYFLRSGDPLIRDSALDPTFLAILVTVVTGLLIALALASTIAHRHVDLARKLSAMNEELSCSRLALETLNATLEQQVAKEVARNREKDHMLIQQSRLAAMGEMVHNIAHQWRQPLNALSILLGNIKDAHQFKELDETSLNSMVGDGNRLITRMSTTIDDFRNFFRPNKEKLAFDLCQMYAETRHILHASLTHQQIKVKSDLADEVVVLGYANEFAQVLLNLLNNAKEAILERGVSTGEITVTICAENGEGVVRVRDNGGGIPNDALPRIFDPYFTTKASGSGIGLYMSKMIIEGNMGGRIEARNVTDGAEFTVSCPLAAALKPVPD